MNSSALAAGIIAVALFPIYAYIGVRLLGRATPPSGRLAVGQFSLWWIGIGGSGAVGGLETILGVTGHLTYPIVITATLVVDVTDVAFLWGLVGYLIYVYTGRYRLVPLSLFYAAFYVAVVYYTFSLGPTGYQLVAGMPELTYASSTADPILTGFVIFALLVPEFGAAIAYLTLLRRTTDRTLRYRIALVGTSILLWFGVALFASGATEAMTVFRAVVEAGAAALSLIAFFPPVWIQQRFGVTPVETVDAVARPA